MKSLATYTFLFVVLAALHYAIVFILASYAVTLGITLSIPLWSIGPSVHELLASDIPEFSLPRAALNVLMFPANRMADPMLLAPPRISLIWAALITLCAYVLNTRPTKKSV